MEVPAEVTLALSTTCWGLQTGLAFITTWSSLNHRKSRTVTSSLESSNPTQFNFLAFLLQRFIVAELLGRTLVPCGCQLLSYFSKRYLVPYCSAELFLYRSTAPNLQKQGYLTVSPSTDSVRSPCEHSCCLCCANWRRCL